MKRRLFLQSLGAFAGGGLFRPSFAMRQISRASPNIALKMSTPSPYMQGHALAILRQNPAMSHVSFLAKTGLNEAHAQVILGRFVELGHLPAQAMQSGVLNATRPEWMKTARAFAKSMREIGEAVANQAIGDKGEAPQFVEIRNCCEAQETASEDALEDEAVKI